MNMDFQSLEVTIVATVNATDSYLDRLCDLRRGRFPIHTSPDSVHMALFLLQRARRAELIDPEPRKEE
jgi:hypothetical protein